MDNIFEFAVRNKVRFEYKGLLMVEDLWDLPVAELDKVYKKLNAKMKLSEEESLLAKPDKSDEITKVQIDIIKYIVNTKLEEATQKVKAVELKAKKEKLLRVLADKENEELNKYSADDIRKMLADME